MTVPADHGTPTGKWRCRLFGHRYREPLTGHRIHGFGPDWSTPAGRLIGVCERCGTEWRYRP